MNDQPEIDRLRGSVFLQTLVRRYPECLTTNAGQVIDEICTLLANNWRDCDSEEALKDFVRDARNRAALAIALADLKNRWSLEKVVAALTRIADGCVNAAVNWLLRDAQLRGQMSGLDECAPGTASGYIVLALGKHGARELNFSSDIDLIILYDPQIAPLANDVQAATFFVRLTRRLVSILQNQTAKGYAYRVDLRLRPDPRATQVAISVDAALVYYESMGQNWERAAMIKARPVAGDLAAASNFVRDTRPFVWRKYLDFAAIAEVHALKRQIHLVKGHGKITVLGHNVKLGRGGIREIEFFVQTQQLIAGGRNPALRGMSSLAMLDALAEHDWITPQTADRLKQAYRFLRTIEHRIQMIGDQQTHLLPATQEAFDSFASFCGYTDPALLVAQLTQTFEYVQARYDALFGDDEHDSHQVLTFSGSENDPDTLAKLATLGFSNPPEVSATIKAWYAGRYRATRTETARERLDELLPALLTVISQSGSPDSTFAAFDRFLAGLPTGIQLFSLLRAHPKFLELIARILGVAPRLASELSRRPRLIDAVFDPEFFTAIPDETAFAAIVNAGVPSTSSYDQALDQARICGREQMFRLGVGTLAGTLRANAAGRAYSDLAEALVSRLLDLVRENLRDIHGLVPGGRVCVVAMGKLGGREMSAASDLDLIVIYDHDGDAIASDGKKPIAPSQYFARMTQRLITALSAPTPEGVLYEVDMRLRPSGNKGPVATSLAAFIDYQAHSAWTWEKMALTRARVVAGDAALGGQVTTAIAHTLQAQRSLGDVARDARDMRIRMIAEKKPQSVWDLKNIRGGIVDLEFIIQVLQIVHARKQPDILQTGMLAAIDKLACHNIISAETGSQLSGICTLYQNLTQVLKLAVAGTFDPRQAPAGLAKIIAATADAPDLARAEQLIAESQQTIARLFSQLVSDHASGDSETP